MCGRLDGQTSGQLAVMDAIVFFVAAMTVSSVLLSYARPPGDRSLEDFDGDADPAEVLGVFLEASIGERLTLQFEEHVTVDASEDVAHCLAVEVAALRSGVARAAFADLNSVLERMLRSICNPSFEPCLMIVELGNGAGNVVLALLDPPGAAENVYASSAELRVDDGDPCLVELVLGPATPPELVDV